MTAVVASSSGKAHAIDKVLKDPSLLVQEDEKEIDPFVNFGYVTPDVEWPDQGVVPAAGGVEKSKSKTKEPEKEEDIYGYGYAAPTPRKNQTNRVPRRSSLSSSGVGKVSRRSSIGYTGEMTLVLPDGKTSKRRTSITFNEEANNSVKTIESVTSLTTQPKKLWFQKSEYAHIQRKVHELVNNKNDDAKKKKTSSDEDTTRGLESLMDSNLSVMDKREALDAVLDEQTNQKLNGTYDPNFIKDAYSYACMDSSIRAQERADQDSQQVEEYLKVTRRMCRRMSC